MEWPGILVHARFLRRYKRFLADFRLDDGSLVTAHCANTGSMVSCLEPDAPALLTYHHSPKRKLKYSWQAIKCPDGWVGINTSLANNLVREAIENGTIAELSGFDTITAERKLGKNSRIDLVLENRHERCVVEVKNVTLYLGDGNAAFPDAVTVRGAKHLKELARAARRGQRAALVYCVQREAAECVSSARDRDPHYAEMLMLAKSAGVDLIAYRAAIEERGVALTTKLPVVLDNEPAA